MITNDAPLFFMSSVTGCIIYFIKFYQLVKFKKFWCFQCVDVSIYIFLVE